MAERSPMNVSLKIWSILNILFLLFIIGSALV